MALAEGAGREAPAHRSVVGGQLSRGVAEAWFDRQMKALDDFEVTVTFCFTPEHRGVKPHHTSPPLHAEEFAEFCARMVRRYA